MFNGSPIRFRRWLKGLVRYATITLPASQLAERHELGAGTRRKSRTKKVRTMPPKKRKPKNRR